MYLTFIVVSHFLNESVSQPPVIHTVQGGCKKPLVFTFISLCRSASRKIKSRSLKNFSASFPEWFEQYETDTLSPATLACLAVILCPGLCDPCLRVFFCHRRSRNILILSLQNLETSVSEHCEEIFQSIPCAPAEILEFKLVSLNSWTFYLSDSLRFVTVRYAKS